jgi:hypothetical protein
MNRASRRFRAVVESHVMADEDMARRTGRWAPWERLDIGSEMVTAVLGCAPDGWMGQVDTVWRNGWCVVMRRRLALAWGPADHAILRTARNAELGWAEKQRIKDEIFGTDRVAVEVLPAAGDVVDAADIYHLWVLPPGFCLPFGLHLDPRAGR